MEIASQLSKWRDFFGTAPNSDIFDVIEQAIKIAASDFPRELLLQRDAIAEALFSCNLQKKVISTTCPAPKDRHIHGGEVINDATTIEKRDDDDTLSEDDTRIYAEVLRIKREFDIDSSRRSQDHSISTVSHLCDLLRRLHGMGLSMKTLEDTQIVKSVNAIRYKYWLDESVHLLVRELIEEWRVTINSERTRDPKPSSVVIKDQSFVKTDHQQAKAPPSMDQEKENTNKNVMKTNQKRSEKAAAVAVNNHSERESQVVRRVSQQQGLKRKPAQLEAPSYNTLEASRKIQERYQQVENAKRQHRVQVVDWHDIPQQCLQQTRNKPLSTRRQVHWSR